MLFISPEGRRESLWVEELSPSTFRVLSVPVWVYGISVGTIVAATATNQSPLSFSHVIRQSAGGTVRIMAPSGRLASDLYKTRVISDARRLGLFIGPSTFFDPRLVAINVRDRSKWWPEVGGYLDALVAEGVLLEWEVADPDEYASEHAADETLVQVTQAVLRHPLPFDGDVERHVS